MVKMFNAQYNSDEDVEVVRPGNIEQQTLDTPSFPQQQEAVDFPKVDQEIIGMSHPGLVKEEKVKKKRRKKQKEPKEVLNHTKDEENNSTCVDSSRQNAENSPENKPVQGDIITSMPENPTGDEDDRLFPESFAEGKTEHILYFLQTKRYVLDDKSCSPNIQLTNKDRPDRAKRNISKKTTDAIRGAIGFRDGVHVIEISFNDKPWGTQCTVGVCDDQAPLYCEGYSHLIGDSLGGWVWDIASRTLHHAGSLMGNFPRDPNTPVPRTFRLTLARESGTLAIDIGGGNVIVFDDMPDSKTVLYPVVAMVYGLAEVSMTVISSDLLDKYMWLPRAADRARKRKKHKKNLGSAEQSAKHLTNIQQNKILKNDKNLVIANEGIGDKPGNSATIDEKREGEREKFEIILPAENNSDKDIPVGGKYIENNPERDLRGREAIAPSGETHPNRLLKITRSLTVSGNETASSIRARLGGEVTGYRSDKPDDLDPDNESSADEDKDYDEERMRVDSLEPVDQVWFHMVHGWDMTNKGSLIQPYPNAPHIAVPLPPIETKIQAVRSRRGFSGKGIHTWMIKEVIMFTPLVRPECMAYQRNHVIVGVATNEQRKFNFGYDMDEVGNEIWGFEYPDLNIRHGKRCYKPKLNGKNPKQIDLEGFDFELSHGLEMTLNLVTHRLTFEHKGKVLAELKHVKGETLYPFVMFVKEAYYPLEINYVEGPKVYFEDVLSGMDDISNYEKESVVNKRLLAKRSSSILKENENQLVRQQYNWGCHSQNVEVHNKVTLSGPGVAVAAFPLAGSRHKVTFYVDGAAKGFSIGFVHHEYPLQPIMQDSLGYLGNDLLSWSWDIDKRQIVHACRVIGKYPIEEQDFNQNDVDAYTMTLDFTQLGNSTASFTAHMDDKKTIKELGIAFITIPTKVLPAVVIRGTNQKLRMEYTAGPWRAAGMTVNRSPTGSSADATSRTCIIM